MTESYPITGIPTRVLNVSDRPLPQPLRQEVDDWYQAVDVNGNKKNEIQINLFFLALTKFQAMDVPDLLSYFRVAGIHGQPQRSWDEEVEEALDQSYCTHNRLLFPPWHRPYLLLYEQRLYEIMIDEIKNFPIESQDRLRAAAASWRLPYWDWAATRAYPIGSAPDYHVPLIVREKEVEITFGHGPNQATTTEWRPNPMYKFSTPNLMGDYGDYSIKTITEDGVDYTYGKLYATSRQPQFTDPKNPEGDEAWIEGVQNNDKVDEALQQHDWYQQGVADTRYIAEATARIFGIPQYDDFASTKYKAQGAEGEYISLEYIHNNIHNWVGGPGGHMSDIPVAAFDPIFWMHHNNVDRIFAIWQTLHSDAWFEPKEDETDTPATPLAPFHIDKDHTLYTPDLARDWFQLHYSYPELQPWLDKYYDDRKFNKENYLRDIRRQLNNLYGSARKNVLQLSDYSPGTEFTDYVINVIYERHALGGASYTIHFFLKDTKNAKFDKDSNPVPVEIGSVYNFSSPNEGCENCRRQEAAGERSRAQVPISSALLAELIRPSSHSTPWQAWEGTDVERYLTDHLDWTVTKGLGEQVPLGDIPSLTIFVASGKAIHHKEPERLSEHKDYKPLRRVTLGKLGGLKNGYAF